MQLTTRGLAELIATGELSRIYQEALSVKKSENIADTPEGGVETTLLPVVGKCTVPTWPVYLTLITKSSASGSFEINPLKRAASAVTSRLPLVGEGAVSTTYYTPAANLSGWESISKEECPPRMRKQAVLGNFEVWVDVTYPNASNQIVEVQNLVWLLGDLVLRCDIKKRIRSEALSNGFRFMPTTTTSVTITEDVAPFAIYARNDASIEYRLNDNSWHLLDTGFTPGAINNYSQHNELLVMPHEGTYTLTGEQIAKLAMSCDGAMAQLGSVYEENLSKFLLGSRFQITHPLDTEGFFMRFAQNAATSYHKFVSTPRKSWFPVYFYNKGTNKTYAVNDEMYLLQADRVPLNLKTAGTVGNYDILYEESVDTYTSRQLGWFAKVVMDSPIISQTKGVIAMRGCMGYLNSILSNLYMVGVVKKLPAVEGTRINDLSPDRAASLVYRAAFGFQNANTRDYGYASDTGEFRPIPGKNTASPVYAACSENIYPAAVIGNMLVKLSESGMLEDANRAIAASPVSDNNKPAAAIMEWYSRSAHVTEPAFVNNGTGLYLEVDNKVYVSSEEYGWAISKEERVPVMAEEVGQFFGHRLFASPDADIDVTGTMLQELFISSLRYFVSFAELPDLFAWLYTADTDGPWYDCEDPESIEGSFVLVPLPKSGERIALEYTVRKNAWEIVEPENITNSYNVTVGNMGIYMSRGFKHNSSTLIDALHALQRQLYMVQSMKRVVSDEDRVRFREYRPVVRTTDNSGPISYWKYTFDVEDGSWLYYGSGKDFVVNEEEIDEQTFAYAFLDWVCVFMNFYAAEPALDYFVNCLGQEVLQTDELLPPIIHLWANASFVFKYDNGEWDGFKSEYPPAVQHSDTFSGINVGFAAKVDCMSAKDFVEAITFDTMLSALMKETARASGANGSEIQAAIEKYQRTVPGRYEAKCDEWRERKIEGAQFICIEKDGILYGFDGDRWGTSLLDSSVMRYMGDLGTCRVYMPPNMEHYTVTTTVANYCLAEAIEFFLPPPTNREELQDAALTFAFRRA